MLADVAADASAYMYVAASTLQQKIRVWKIIIVEDK